MRKVLFLALMALFAGASARADPATRERLRRYFASWFSVCPGTGLNSTPVFFYRGVLLTAEPAFAESYIQGRLGAPTASGRGASR
jgi:hypothetical protein